MEVIEYKLSTNNPTLISHGIWKLLEIVKQKVKSGESESKITELKYLLKQCESSNGIVSSTACQAVVALAGSKVITVPVTISHLTVCLVNAKHYGAVASAICSLLTLELKMWDSQTEYNCPFNLTAPQHPLITVLLQKKDAWRDVLNDVQTLMNHCNAESVENHVTLMRPVFLYILCNPTLSLPESCRQHAWNLLIKSNGTLNVQIEVLQWLRTINAECCIDKNNRILELVELEISKGNSSFTSALIPLLMSMALKILQHNGDPRPTLDILSSILQHDYTDSGSILVFMAAEMISITSSVYLLDIVTIVMTLLERTSCNRTIAHCVIAAILPWMAYPSILTSDALDVAKDLFGRITNLVSRKYSTKKIYTEEPYSRLRYADTNVQFYTELTACAESWTQENILAWLDKLAKAPNYVLNNYKHIVAAIFLENKNTLVVQKSCDILVKNATNGGHALSSILYKLTKTQDIDQTKTVLSALPKLVGSKENVPIIMNTLKTFSEAGKPLSYLAIELYVQTLKFEPRCNRYLQSALFELNASDSTAMAGVTCARAMKYVCENHPEHGRDLVSLLSQTLDCSLKKSNSKATAAACALALKGISALCIAGVTEITSTWRVLAAKMNIETRSIVLQALCELFGNVPHNPTQEGPEYNKFVNEILTKLWSYALDFPDAKVSISAFKALTAFPLENMPFSVLPENWRNYVPKTDDSKNPQDDEEEKKADELLPYIPAELWIPMLENSRKPSIVGDFLQHCIGEELYGFRTGLYRWTNGEPVNFKYLSEKSVVRAIGEHIRHYKASGDTEKQNIIIECLRIFSHKYPKPLPPVQFKYFDAAIRVSSQTQKYGLALACHQAQISSTAKNFLEKQLTIFTKECATADVERFKECLDLYEKLDDICRAVGSIVLGPFLEATLNRILEKASLDKESSAAMFDEVMGCFAKALKDELIHNDNRSLLFSWLEKLIDRIDVDSTMFRSYTTATMELTSEQLERMTLPSVWLNITTEKLKKAIIIRAEMVLKKREDTPLNWMNEIIRASALTPEVHSCLLEQLQRILSEIRLEKTSANWTLQLMRRISATNIDEKNENQTIETISFMCEILFITVICLSATDCLLTNDRTLVESHDVRAKLFPQALASIIQMAYWRDIVSHTMEWLNHMRASSIPRMYKIVFHNALVSLKNEDYFSVTWTKYLSIRAPN